MDNIILEKKIDSILRCIARIEERLPENEENFLKDYDAQDVIVLSRTRAVQLRVDIAVHILSKENQAVPATMSEAFMKVAAGRPIIIPNSRKDEKICWLSKCCDTQL